jgi:RadC-like JAB domain
MVHNHPSGDPSPSEADLRLTRRIVEASKKGSLRSPTTESAGGNKCAIIARNNGNATLPPFEDEDENDFAKSRSPQFSPRRRLRDPLSWPMIVRQWKGWAQKDRASDYVRYFATQLQPKLSIIPGYKKALVLTREQGGETEIVTMTFFDRLEDVAGFAGERYEVANVSAEAQRLLSHFDKTVSHFEVALETAK